MNQMIKTKETIILGFAIFAGFFGAGNLILPPMLGFKAGSDWWIVTLGFLLSATVIPLLALFGHARLQGTMIDFGRKVSHKFGLLFSIGIYIIAITLPCPRTAAVTHEMAIQPYFSASSLATSSVYFLLVFIFVINRGKVIKFLGKFLTPIIVVIVMAIILIGVFGPSSQLADGMFESPLSIGFTEGYQTYDAIAGLLMGGVLVVSVHNSKRNMPFQEKQKMIATSSFIAMLGLFVIYVGLIYVGSRYQTLFESEISRTNLLAGISTEVLGETGTLFLSVLIALACFTTAVSIIIGTADFFKSLFSDKSEKVYIITAGISCLLGILIGQFEVKFLIDFAVYILMFLYPISIVLIVLNLIPEKYAHQKVFRTVVFIAFIFSIPDFLKLVMPAEELSLVYAYIPLSKDSLGWVLPSILAFFVVNILIKIKEVKQA